MLLKLARASKLDADESEESAGADVVEVLRVGQVLRDGAFACCKESFCRRKGRDLNSRQGVGGRRRIADARQCKSSCGHSCTVERSLTEVVLVRDLLDDVGPDKEWEDRVCCLVVDVEEPEDGRDWNDEIRLPVAQTNA